MLYSDANSRFNTLIEECAHLQDTVIGLTADPDLLDSIIAYAPARNEVRGFSRTICCEAKRSPRYYEATVRDRAFLSLWTLLGGLIIALDANQRTHEHAYRRTVEATLRGEFPHDGPTAESQTSKVPIRAVSDHLFWYVQTRGYFLTEVCKHYTTQLEHAHEKLIQMLENQPGKLPTPILLRRWNSALYGAFLSEYSRHVNWESHRLLAATLGGGVGLESRTLTQDLSLTHTWTHQPTSMAQLFKVGLKTAAAGTAGEAQFAEHRFATVRSAYFYLELPILLPLLYHECAHIAVSNSAFDRPTPDADRHGFLDARERAVLSLRLASFPDVGAPVSYENFWDHFTEEIWADAVAIALGGRAYLTALTLQLVGLSGEDNFDHYNLDRDALHELDSLGTFVRRKYPEPHPREDVAFFWEARLLIASDLLALADSAASKETGVGPKPAGSGTRNPGSPADPDAAWIFAIRRLLSAYHGSGHQAHHRDGTSARHEALWDYRWELNQWVRETTMRCLAPAFRRLLERTPICSTYSLASGSHLQGERRGLVALVNAYREKYMRGCAGEFSLATNARLETLPADIRWQVAADIAVELTKPEHDASGMQTRRRHDMAPSFLMRIENWSTRYANWMRHDGSAAFRVALEASRLRMSLYDLLAERLTEKLTAAEAQRKTSQALADAIAVDPDAQGIDDIREAATAASRRNAALDPFRAPFQQIRLSRDERMSLWQDPKSAERVRRREATNLPTPEDSLLIACRDEVDRLVDAAMRRLHAYFRRQGRRARKDADRLQAEAASRNPTCWGRPSSDRSSVAATSRHEAALGEALVGTLSLGVIRPDEIARTPRAADGPASPYMAGLAAVRAQWESACQGHRNEAQSVEPPHYLKTPPDIRHAFAHLLGDYQYLTYAKGVTPIERDFHAGHAGQDRDRGSDASSSRFIRRLVKPRMVLQLAGRELAGAIEEYGKAHWGRLSLIRLKHRWQWVEVAHRLKCNRKEMVGFALLTSSAWEDLILFTWFHTQEEAWGKVREIFGIKPGESTGMDIQSMFIPPLDRCDAGSIPDQAPRKADWEERLFDWAVESQCVERIYSRTGRLDYTVIWKANDADGKPDILGNCFRGLTSIPKEIWTQISSMISSYEVMRWPPEKACKPGEEESEDAKQARLQELARMPKTDSGQVMKCDVVTHFAVKNRT
ncbi:hypothetical protein [Roseateles noduli]|uniref:hypothetical protein n=1 Tax=Roseateles noduli TaxID=2052484 RepID=UPI003D660C7A